MIDPIAAVENRLSKRSTLGGMLKRSLSMFALPESHTNMLKRCLSMPPKAERMQPGPGRLRLQNLHPGDRIPTAMTNYEVYCECGATKRVSAQQAGSQITCSCGRSLDVPNLSQLRASIGEEAIPLGIVDRINIMINKGEVPESKTCPHSGLPSDDTIYVRVECERSWLRGSEWWNWWFLAPFVMITGVFGAVLALNRPERPERQGRDTVINVPVPISRDARMEILKTRNQKKWKAWLRQEPVYAELLEEFPEARIEPVESI